MRFWTPKTLLIVLILALVSLPAALVSGQVVCKYCGTSAGVAVCLPILNESQQGYEDCTAGELCFYLGGAQWCFGNACYATQSCILAPSPGLGF